MSYRTITNQKTKANEGNFHHTYSLRPLKSKLWGNTLYLKKCGNFYWILLANKFAQAITKRNISTKFENKSVKRFLQRADISSLRIPLKMYSGDQDRCSFYGPGSWILPRPLSELVSQFFYVKSLINYETQTVPLSVRCWTKFCVNFEFTLLKFALPNTKADDREFSQHVPQKSKLWGNTATQILRVISFFIWGSILLYSFAQQT